MNTDTGSGLSALKHLKLDDPRERMLQAARTSSLGSAVWRARKSEEARSIFRLCRLAPAGRLNVTMCDLSAALRMILEMRTPVPCRRADGDLVVEEKALLGLTYPEQAMCQPLPGYAFVLILAPANVWHANVAMQAHGQPLCLGQTMPAGVRTLELVLATYAALAMQNTMLDERDAAGVMNPLAAAWWQQNTDRIPLSRTPFLSTESELGMEQQGD